MAIVSYNISFWDTHSLRFSCVQFVVMQKAFQMIIIFCLYSDVGERLYLSPYIAGGDIETAQSLARVTEPLDGMQGSQPDSFSGFITVNEDAGSNIFFWFFPAQVDATYK